MDAKSFRKANDAIHGVKDGVLQLAAAAGVGMGLKELTSGVASSVLEMTRLSKITGFTVKQIEGLRYAMRNAGLNADSANKLVQQVPTWRQASTLNELPEKAYWNGKFNPTEMMDKSKSNQDILEYVLDSYNKMDNDQRRTLRSGLPGLGENDDVTRLFEGGLKSFRNSEKHFNENLYQPIDQKTVDSATEFNHQMADLQTNFENLSTQIAGPLLKSVNEFLKATNHFIQEHPQESKAVLGGAAVLAGNSAINLVKRFLPGGVSEGAAQRGLMSRLLLNPFTIEAIAALAPGNIDTSDDDARAMSNPEALKKKNWEHNHPGVPYPEDKYSPQYLLKHRALTQQAPDQHAQAAKAQLNDLVDKPNVRKYLDALSKSEGTYARKESGYHTLFKGDMFADMHDHPRIYKTYKQPDGNVIKTSAAGRYQITSSSWDDAQKALNLPDFSKRSQDIAALYLIQRAGQLKNVVTGRYDDATAGLGGVWASLPSSHYAQPKHDVATMQRFYGQGVEQVNPTNGNGLEALQGYYAMRNTPPTPPTYAGGSGDSHVHQTNHIVIHAPGGDPAEIDRRLSQALTTHSQQAQAMLASDLF